MVFIWGDSNIYKPTERTIDEERVPPRRMDIMVTGALAAATRQEAHQMHPAAVQLCSCCNETHVSCLMSIDDG